ncbi:HAD-like protein [Ascobolus immersus RN42]|uniref:HAD-like protein n=1 Tax=Ascobolus immersus RN42 TaxID=1160509 RepID=A0A3N4I9M7_ASCIM|nr:HAD-like protein [Ascobolus immersus RN42]
MSRFLYKASRCPLIWSSSSLLLRTSSSPSAPRTSSYLFTTATAIQRPHLTASKPLAVPSRASNPKMTVTQHIEVADAPALDPTLPIKALFFDLDDTLLLNPTIINLDSALKDHGAEPYPSNQHAMIAGLTAEGMVEAIHKWAPHATYDQLMEAYARWRTERMGECVIREGVKDLITRLANAQTVIQTTEVKKPAPSRTVSNRDITTPHSTLNNLNKVDIAIVTNSALERAAAKLKPYPELTSVFSSPDQLVTTSHELAKSRNVKSKPHPDLYNLALDIVNKARKARGAMELLPSECLVFEDSIVGIKAARAAGMRVIWNPVDNVKKFCEKLVNGDPDCTVGLDKHDFGHHVEDHKKWWNGQDPWVEVVQTFENFDLKKYGIEVISAEK